MFYATEKTDEEAGMLYQEILEYCLKFVGVNYRIGRYEQAVLRLIDRTDAVWGGVFRAVVDQPFVIAELAAKKKDTKP